MGRLQSGASRKETSIARARSFYDPESNPFRKVGRNDPCPCGSGKKFKKCCLNANLAS
ncbi:SEC-C metal-binding domain-containing protein [Bradyrhizobium sp. 186]|uniref:SEC-C metal-binding domain-containing protein n=1 Tax=Bradyrhizobium sp. 186 TaxID=2782654 RepID=UPI002111E725|nr:SEC-C metal-binding domain-containing protein [Bradyrhizobium sp. 186]